MDYKSFSNLRSFSKTLRFRLIPQGATEALIAQNRILESDDRRAKKYPLAKTMIDNYHRAYIERMLCDFAFGSETLLRYAEYYYEDEGEKLLALQKEMMKKVGDSFSRSAEYKKLMGAELFKELLPKTAQTEEEFDCITEFAKFTTYFAGFHQNRKNMYTGEGKSTEIAFRIVAQNLPKHLDNIKLAKRLPQELLVQNDIELCDLIGLDSERIFKPEAFDLFLSQSGIDRFNTYIGGYTTSDGTKVQGLNERIEEHAKKIGQKLPLLKPLFKQILSDRESVSFVPIQFESDREVLAAVGQFQESSIAPIGALEDLLCTIDSADIAHIYVKNDTEISALSTVLCGSWSVLGGELGGGQEQAGARTRKTAKKKSYSLAELFEIYAKKIGREEDAAGIIKTHTEEKLRAITQAYEAARELLLVPYPETQKLSKDAKAVQAIKGYLDSIKAFERFAAIFAGVGEEPDKDGIFYGIFEQNYQALREVDRLYDRVRNYITKKPFSTDKIKLNFDSSSLLGGWAQFEEWSGKEAHWFEKDGTYYLFLTARTLKREEWQTPLFDTEGKATAYHLQYFFQKPDNKNVPRLFIRTKGDKFSDSVREYQLPIEDVIDIYDQGLFKTEYRKKDPEGYRAALTKMIDYFKLGLSRHRSYRVFDFRWKPTEEYTDIAEFYRDTMASTYKIVRKKVNFDGLLQMVEEGKGYLFALYSKDFSPCAKGTPNLHTLYLRALFSPVGEGRVRLQGGAEIFFRRASLAVKDTTVHAANQPIAKKRKGHTEERASFAYDLIKDRRYTRDHYELHFPIEFNSGADGMTSLNEMVQREIVSADTQYVIGIDRGERNLLYYTLIDSEGRIVKQGSLNEIVSEYRGVRYVTDHHHILKERGDDRTAARRDWQTIAQIKDTKEGYLSQAVHFICGLAKEYGAIIVLENLNSGFKNMRSAVEHSVYQKFEKMLCDKLAYLVDKKQAPDTPGGYMNGYQLAAPITNYTEMHGQNGILFYIPAQLTSKIDPTTGFVDLLHPRYVSVEQSKAFFARFADIRYCEQEEYFVFDTDLAEFERTEMSYRTRWEICTFGDRIERHRDKNSGQWKHRRVALTEEFAELFADFGIDYRSSLKSAILQQECAEFFKRLTFLLALVLQMRNSSSDEDYLISPVKNKGGVFFDSRTADESLPRDADANGAYHIARKGLWLVERMREQRPENGEKIRLDKMSMKQWLAYAQADK